VSELSYLLHYILVTCLVLKEHCASLKVDDVVGNSWK